MRKKTAFSLRISKNYGLGEVAILFYKSNIQLRVAAKKKGVCRPGILFPGLTGFLYMKKRAVSYSPT